MTVAIIGAGVMGETLLSGLLRGGRDAPAPSSRSLRPHFFEIRDLRKNVRFWGRSASLLIR